MKTHSHADTRVLEFDRNVCCIVLARGRIFLTPGAKQLAPNVAR
jgi:hypothetical protein